jgi:hypothetical protein
MIRRTLILTMLVLGASAQPAQAAGGGDYLASRLTLSGGFAEPGGSASVSLTEWSVMGLKAAGRSPGTMHRSGGKTPTAFLAARAKGWHDAYSLERGILAVVALGKNPASFAGRNLVRSLRSTVAANGRIGRYSNSTYWGVLAFRAAGATLPSHSLAYVRSLQGTGGGYSYAPGTAADSNDTAAAVMALRSGGIPCNWKAVGHAYDFMHGLQRSDHGYALGGASAVSDSQSTSWVIQARIKCRLANGGALTYLADRKRTNGSYEYRAGLVQTPAWVTAQVLPAVNGRAYPIR